MKYKVILCDAPWSYRNKNTGGSMSSGSANKYSTLSMEDIKNLPISEISDKNSVLYLWATTPLLPEALEVLQYWGFKYKTALYWRKIMSLGMGFWYRGQVEMLLMGVRGNLKAFRIQKPNFIQTKVRKHSQKPDEFYDLIEENKLTPRIELFATSKRKGWTSIGYEIDGLDIREAMEKVIEK